MTKDIPTQVGDVLILQTKQSYTIYAVGRVSKNGQQDFGSGKDVKYKNDYGAAVAEAKKPFSWVVGGCSFGTSTRTIGLSSEVFA